MKLTESILTPIFSPADNDNTTFRQDLNTSIQLEPFRLDCIEKAMKTIAWMAWSRGMSENLEQEREWFEIWFDSEPDSIFNFCDNCAQLTFRLNGCCKNCGNITN